MAIFPLMPTTEAEENIKRIQVAVGVICNTNGEVLIQQRPHEPMAGKWEFPGGKLDVGEDAETALIREFYEELHLQVIRVEPLTQIYHDYSHGKVQLNVFWIDRYIGKPIPQEKQSIRWVRVKEFDDIDYLTGNATILTAIRTRLSSREFC